MVYGRAEWLIARQEEKRQDFWTERKGEEINLGRADRPEEMGRKQDTQEDR